LIRESVTYSWINGTLYKCGVDNILRKCIRKDEVFDVLRTYHDEPIGGHYSNKRTALKVLGASYYWPSLHKDVRNYVNQCQRMGEPTNSTQMPLHPQVVIEPFE